MRRTENFNLLGVGIRWRTHEATRIAVWPSLEPRLLEHLECDLQPSPLNSLSVVGEEVITAIPCV